MTDTPDDSAWIGRSETAATDLITPRLINSFAATLAPCLAADASARRWLRPRVLTPTGIR